MLLPTKNPKIDKADGEKFICFSIVIGNKSSDFKTLQEAMTFWWSNLLAGDLRCYKAEPTEKFTEGGFDYDRGERLDYICSERIWNIAYVSWEAWEEDYYDWSEDWTVEDTSHGCPI